MGIKITGIGKYMPNTIVSNDDFAKLVETSDEWIVKRTGIKYRRMSSGELAYQMGAKAAKEAMDDAGIGADDIDIILATTITPDCLTPSVASLIGCEIGSVRAATMDVNGACSGFLYALDMARNFLELGSYRNILIVATEVLSRILDFEDRSTCVLFGDAAGATIVTKGDGNYASYLGGNPKGAYEICAKLKYPKNPFSNKEEQFENLEVANMSYGFIHMNGEQVFKFATKTLPQIVREVIKRAGITLEQLDMLIPHQANVRILEAANNRLGLPKEKMYVGIKEYGNVSSACIPIALYQLKKEGKIEDQQNMCLAGFGAGLTFGAILFQW